MPIGWGGHLLLNNLFSDMFIKANIYYKNINTNRSRGIEKTTFQQSDPIKIVEQEVERFLRPTDTLILFFYTCCKFCCYVYIAIPINIYQSIIQPYFVYCAQVWGCIGKTSAVKVQKLQNRAFRIITHENYTTRSADILKTLGIPNLEKECNDFQFSCTR